MNIKSYLFALAVAAAGATSALAHGGHSGPSMDYASGMNSGKSTGMNVGLNFHDHRFTDRDRDHDRNRRYTDRDHHRRDADRNRHHYIKITKTTKGIIIKTGTTIKTGHGPNTVGYDLKGATSN